MIITVGNNKGGVGKTSVTVNLAASLGRQGVKTLVVDLDSQCNATSILIGNPNMRAPCLYDLLDPEADGVSVEECISDTRHINVWCLSNVEDSSMLDIPLGRGIPESLSLLRNRLRDHAIANYDVTLIDTPPTIGLWLTLALVASDCAIVPIHACSSHSVEGLRRVIDLINVTRASRNPDLRFLRLLVNLADSRTLVTRHVLALVKERFPGQAFETIIPLNTHVQQAELLGKTVFERDPTCRAARAYRALARELSAMLNIHGRESDE
ncbi:MAG: ParA family protein [Desulfosoma sp.]